MFDGNGNDNERPGVEEQYSTACNTSNLTVEARVKGAGDLLIAAGWSAASFGKGVLRLHSEWARVEMPARRKARTVKQFAAILPPKIIGEKKVPDMDAARAAHAAEIADLDRWYERELQRLIGMLNELPRVRAHLTIKAANWGMEDAETKATATIRYWLAQHCKGCNGTKWQLIPGTNRQSDRPCPVCVGRSPKEQHPGFVVPPFAQEGRRLANYIDSCVEDARGVLRANLSAYRRKSERVESAPAEIGADARTEEEKAAMAEAFALGKPRR